MVEFRGVGKRTNVAAMKTDLGNYAEMQEWRHNGDNGYAPSPDSLAGYRFSPHVSATVARSDTNSWWLVVRHDGADDQCLWGRGNGAPAGVVCSSDNVAPVASLAATPERVKIGQAVSFDALGSRDPDGFVAGYKFDFGDNAQESGSSGTSTHEYATSGTYVAAVTVTDALGATNTSTTDVVVDGPPVARLVASPASGTLKAGGTARFSALASSDLEGPITSYNWSFGALGTAADPEVSVRYPTSGTFTVAVTVTDDIGNTASATGEYVVLENQAPVARFVASDVHPDARAAVTFDASGSADPDGSIQGYAWDFGDSSVGTGVSATHAYVTSGAYTARLTVTDDLGATSSTEQTITVPVQAPVLSIVASRDTGMVGDSILYTATVTGGSCLSVAIDWVPSDGSAIQHGLRVGMAYSKPGRQGLTVTASGDCGSVVVDKIIVVQLPLSANFDVVTNTPQAGGNTHFDGEDTNPQTYVSDYSWDYGDFTSGHGTEATCDHVYTAPGDYDAELEAHGNSEYVLAGKKDKEVRVH